MEKVRIISKDGKTVKFIAPHLASDANFLKRNGFMVADPNVSKWGITEPKEFIPELKEPEPLPDITEQAEKKIPVIKKGRPTKKPTSKK